MNLPEFDELGLYSFSDGVAVDGVVGGLKIPFEFVASVLVGENFKSVTGTVPPFTSFLSIVVKHGALTISPFVIRIAHTIFENFKLFSSYEYNLILALVHCNDVLCDKCLKYSQKISVLFSNINRLCHC